MFSHSYCKMLENQNFYLHHVCSAQYNTDSFCQPIFIDICARTIQGLEIQKLPRYLRSLLSWILNLLGYIVQKSISETNE